MTDAQTVHGNCAKTVDGERHQARHLKTGLAAVGVHFRYFVPGPLLADSALWKWEKRKHKIEVNQRPKFVAS